MTSARQQQQFEALWREHGRIAARVARMYARNAEDRRDLVQEIGVQAWRSFRRFDAGRARFSTWMYRIALNVAISHLRRESGRDGRFEPLREYHLESVAGVGGIDLPDQRLALLDALVARLDALDRALILLYLEERSYAEIADILGITITNVATRINRVKQKLRGMAGADTTGA